MSERLFVTTGGKSYVPGLLALARSLAAYCPGDRLIVVETGQISWEDKWSRRLERSGAEILLFHDAEMFDWANKWKAKVLSRYPVETFIKLWLPRLLGEPFWWIDSDVIVRSYIEDKDAINSNFSCALVPHKLCLASMFAEITDSNTEKIMRKYLRDDYFDMKKKPSLNSGLSWFDSALFEKRGLRNEAMSVLSEIGPTLVKADESILNLLGWRYGVGRLDKNLQEFIEYNNQVLTSYSEDDRNCEAATIHFTGSLKPWMRDYPLPWAVELYRSYLSDCSDCEWIAG